MGLNWETLLLSLFIYMLFSYLLFCCGSPHISQFFLNSSTCLCLIITSDVKICPSFIFRFCLSFRLDKRTSLLDVRLECQDVERFSMVNRLGKFHGQSQSEKIDGSSTSTTAPRKTLPQRYVTGFSVSGNIPEGMLCFSL